eukprot:scaffold587_cov17-Prasinocladus_malaysianus.AAC.2
MFTQTIDQLIAHHPHYPTPWQSGAAYHISDMHVCDGYLEVAQDGVDVGPEQPLPVLGVRVRGLRIKAGSA